LPKTQESHLGTHQRLADCSIRWHAEPLVPGPSHLEVETAIAKLKKY
jgi:hypothetical protein